MSKKVTLVTAEIGYGHLRALYPFNDKENHNLVILGKNDSSSLLEKKLWLYTLKLYEGASRYKNLPIIGPVLYNLMEGLLSIPPRNQSKIKNETNFPYWLLERMIKLGLCKGLKSIVDKNTIVFTSFYAPVIALSERKDIKIYCQICDSDLSRVWVTKKPTTSNVEYFSPCQRASERLQLYGVPAQKVYLTGFPFPLELIGGILEEKANKNYYHRLKFLSTPFQFNSSNPLRIAYIIGGAGAYSDIGKKIVLSFKEELNKNCIELYLIVGIKQKIASDYQLFLDKEFPQQKNVHILASESHDEYFNQFTNLIANIHIIWTKPSEIVFYSALGIPIIMTQPLGPQEEANREWLLEIGAGIDQHISNYTSLWVFNKLSSGALYNMAKAGWENGIRGATHMIPEIINNN